jgi:hypothetical protein
MSKKPGNLAVLVALNIAEDKYLPIAGWQLIDSRLQVDPVDQTAQPRIGRSDFFAGPGVPFLTSGDLI